MLFTYEKRTGNGRLMKRFWQRLVLKDILLIRDLDSSYLLAVSRAQLPSVILLRLNDESSQIVNERLGEVLLKRKSDLEAGAIISVNEEAIRVRHLPI